MSCITLVALPVFLRRSEILLTFSRHQVMQRVFFVVSCVKVAYKGLFLMQKHSEEQGQTLVFNHSQQCFGHMVQFRVYDYNCYSVFFS